MLIYLVILGTAIWSFFDAKKIGVRKGLVNGLGNVGPWGWLTINLLLWLPCFPLYLYYRGDYKLAVAKEVNARQPNDFSQNTISSVVELEKLADLKEKGVITEEEFAMKKKKALGL